MITKKCLPMRRRNRKKTRQFQTLATIELMKQGVGEMTSKENAVILDTNFFIYFQDFPQRILEIAEEANRQSRNLFTTEGVYREVRRSYLQRIVKKHCEIRSIPPS